MSDTDASIPRWADHRVVLDACDAADRIAYHLVTSGRIEPIDGGADVRNGGVFGHVDGELAAGRAGYVYGGRILSIKLEPSLVELGVLDHREAPFEVRVDGTPVDFERWDPSRGDLPFGYGGPGALPDDVAIGADDCDLIVSTHGALSAAGRDCGDGAVLGVDADVHLAENPEAALSFHRDDLAVVGIETDDGTLPTLRWDRAPSGENRSALRLAGDRSAVSNLQFRGPLDEHVPYEEYDGRFRGLEFAGDDQVAVNCHGWHWPHAAFAAWGRGETFLCTDAHHNMLGGLGYGFNSSGPAPTHDWDAGETWSEDELEMYRPWHRRTEMKRVLADANRHDVAAGTNASYELRFFVTGPTAVTGHRIDMHCPGGGIVTVGDGIVEESTRGLTEGGENGLMVRGWPVVGARVEGVWFTWGEEPDPDHRYSHDRAPIVQVCATPTTRDRRPDWDASNEPFVGIEWTDCAFGREESGWLREDLRGDRQSPVEKWTADDPG